MDKLKNIITNIKKAMPHSIKWEEDNRFNTMLAVIISGDAAPLHGTLSGLFENSWDSATSGNASKPEKKLIKSLTGLNKEQILFTSAGDGTILFAAWWPWGDKSRVSLRIGLFSPGMEITGRDQVKDFLKGTSKN